MRLTLITKCLKQVYANSDWDFMWPWVNFLYGKPNDMLVFDGPKYAYTVERQDGTMQGENSANFLYDANDLQTKIYRLIRKRNSLSVKQTA